MSDNGAASNTFTEEEIRIIANFFVRCMSNAITVGDEILSEEIYAAGSNEPRLIERMMEYSLGAFIGFVQPTKKELELVYWSPYFIAVACSCYRQYSIQTFMLTMTVQVTSRFLTAMEIDEPLIHTILKIFAVWFMDITMWFYGIRRPT